MVRCLELWNSVVSSATIKKHEPTKNKVKTKFLAAVLPPNRLYRRLYYVRHTFNNLELRDSEEERLTKFG